MLRADLTNLVFICQPIRKINGNEGEKVHEILARVKHNDELITANRFLQYCDHRTLKKIDRLAIQQALKDGSKTHCVNLSPATLLDYSFIKFLIEETDQAGHRNLWLEVTEDVALVDDTLRILQALKCEGFKVGLDDFGTRYNGFLAVQKVRPHFIKLDGEYVRNILTDPVARTLVKAILLTCYELRMFAIAEFVENQAVEDELRAIKLEVANSLTLYGQGWLYGKGELC